MNKLRSPLDYWRLMRAWHLLSPMGTNLWPFWTIKIITVNSTVTIGWRRSMLAVTRSNLAKRWQFCRAKPSNETFSSLAGSGKEWAHATQQTCSITPSIAKLVITRRRAQSSTMIRSCLLATLRPLISAYKAKRPAIQMKKNHCRRSQLPPQEMSSCSNECLKSSRTVITVKKLSSIVRSKTRFQMPNHLSRTKMLRKLKRTTKQLGMSIRRERLPPLRAKSTKTLRLIFASARFSTSSARCFWVKPSRKLQRRRSRKAKSRRQIPKLPKLSEWTIHLCNRLRR